MSKRSVSPDVSMSRSTSLMLRWNTMRPLMRLMKSLAWSPASDAGVFGRTVRIWIFELFQIVLESNKWVIRSCRLAMRVEVWSYIKKSSFRAQNVKHLCGPKSTRIKVILGRSELKSKNLDEPKNICFNIFKVVCYLLLHLMATKDHLIRPIGPTIPFGVWLNTNFQRTPKFDTLKLEVCLFT